MLSGELQKRRLDTWAEMRTMVVGRAKKAMDVLTDMLGHRDWHARISAVKTFLSLTPLGQGEPLPAWQPPDDGEVAGRDGEVASRESRVKKRRRGAQKARRLTTHPTKPDTSRRSTRESGWRVRRARGSRRFLH